MLSGITSYLFGSNNAEEYTGQDEADSTPQRRVRTRATDSDWLIVDQSSSRDSSLDSASTKAKGTVSVSDRQAAKVCMCEPCVKSLNNIYPSNNGGHRGMDESWLVTPPPCFTAGGATPERMETGSMENLLIEHPSMSVYNRRGRPGSAGTDSEQSESSDTDMAASVRKPVSSTKMSVQRRSPRRAKAIAARAGILSNVQAVKSMQRAQVKRNSVSVSRNKLQRSNRVQQYKSNPHRHRQITQPACKSSNRRC